LRTVHYVSIFAALGLLAGIYFLGNTNPPKPKDAPAAAAGGQAMHEHQKEASFDSVLLAAKKTMPQHVLAELMEVDKKIALLQDSVQMVPLLEQYGHIWQEHKQLAVAAFYYSLAAKLEKSEKKLNFAARLFLELAREEHNAGVQAWEVNRAISTFNTNLQLNPDNDTAKLGLAECYFGSGEAMKGVALVKEILQKDPEHIQGNLMLGQQGLVSEQYAKAQQRFETVLKRDPKNLEGMLGLAEAYKGQGQKDQAVTLLEQCKRIINKPEFTKDVDNYIKSFK
jgi:lipopolysaccharide biosynthesis regulator YciM